MTIASPRHRTPRHPATRLTATLLTLCLAGTAAAEPVKLAMWVHAGPGPERDAYVASINAFNNSNANIKVDLMTLPEGSYSDQVNAAALARKLPCVLDFDGPNVYNYAWSGKLLALDGYPVAQKAKAEMLPTLVSQGTYNKKLYSVGQYDSGLAIWGNRKLLTQAGVRIPKGLADAWTLPEFEDALKKLKAAGVATPLDMKFNYGLGEWFTYGFSPIVQSFGGDLINRTNLQSAQGQLNGPGAIKAMTTLQGWIKNGWVNAATRDDGDFANGRAALSYVGHWVYNDYSKALGGDLVLIPSPRFGDKAVTGAGSWNFGISSDCKQPQEAAKVLEHLMSEAEVDRVTRLNGAVPGIRSALQKNKNYAEGGPLHIYVEQILHGVARVRPQTPAYPAITTAFAEAVNNIVGGREVKKELDRAAKKIDEAIEDNNGYPVH